MSTNRHSSTLVSRIVHSCLRLGLVLTLITAIGVTAAAQSAARPDKGIQPIGTYSVSDIENVNLTNGNVNLDIQLAALPPMAGGKLSWNLNAIYNSKLWNQVTQEIEIPGSVPPSRAISSRMGSSRLSGT